MFLKKKLLILICFRGKLINKMAKKDGQLSLKEVKNRTDDGEMDLSLTGIVNIPVISIVAVPRVTSIDLSCNKIEVIPAAFCQRLTNLVSLDLSKNQLVELPNNIGLLIKLKKLDLYQNNLKMLPVGMAKLNQLKWLDIKGNPLNTSISSVAGDCLDDAGCRKCAKSVVEAMKDVQAEMEMVKQKKLKEEKLISQKIQKEKEVREKLEKERKLKEKQALKEKRREQWKMSQAAKNESKINGNAEKKSDSNAQSVNVTKHKNLSYKLSNVFKIFIVLFGIFLAMIFSFKEKLPFQAAENCNYVQETLIQNSKLFLDQLISSCLTFHQMVLNYLN